jgi:hypothetical protein
MTSAEVRPRSRRSGLRRTESPREPVNDFSGVHACGRGIRAFLAAAGLLLFAAFSPVKAEIGPCLPDRDNGLTCGQGAGAARVVEGTTSPSKHLAFAWRSPGRPPTDAADGGTVESLLIRLSDGAVLSSLPGDYWRVGDMVANHIDETAAWSPSSRFVVETTDLKWETKYVRLYAIGTDDKVLVLDLKPIIEPAVRKHLRQLVRNEPAFTFPIERLTIDDRGLIKALVLMQIPKQDRDVELDVALKVAPNDGGLAARDISVRRSRAKP